MKARKKGEKEMKIMAAAAMCPVLGGSGAWVAPQVSAITLLATALDAAIALEASQGGGGGDQSEGGKNMVVVSVNFYNKEHLCPSSNTFQNSWFMSSKLPCLYPNA